MNSFPNLPKSLGGPQSATALPLPGIGEVREVEQPEIGLARLQVIAMARGQDQETVAVVRRLDARDQILNFSRQIGCRRTSFALAKSPTLNAESHWHVLISRFSHS